MYWRTISTVPFALAALLSTSAWAQVGSLGGGPNRIPPSEAATVRTPGTPGAADTPEALQGSSHNHRPAVSLSRADRALLKKQANKSWRSSAPAANASKNTSAAPPK
jgi:hypothetical protein